MSNSLGAAWQQPRSSRDRVRAAWLATLSGPQWSSCTTLAWSKKHAQPWPGGKTERSSLLTWGSHFGSQNRSKIHEQHKKSIVFLFRI